MRPILKTKILVFIDWYLPGYKAGGPISSVRNMICRFRDNYDFYIITRNTDYLSSQPYAGVSPNQWLCRSEGCHVLYASSRFLHFDNLYRIVKDLSPDVIYINGIYSWYFSILPLLIAIKASAHSIIVASRGMLSQHAINIKGAKKRIFLKAASLIGLYNNVLFHATSSDEASAIRKLIGNNSHIYVAPNLPPSFDSTGERSSISILKKPGAIRLVSVGRISPEKNNLYALRILSKCNRGNIEYDFYGSIYDKLYWEACKNTIARLPANIIVHYKGPIEPERIYGVFQNYHFTFMPSRGENFGHSILESIICGTPVIISDKTPWKYLEGEWRDKSTNHEKEAFHIYPSEKVGWAIPLQDENRFVSVIMNCVDMGPDEYLKLSSAARRYGALLTASPSLTEPYIHMFSPAMAIQH